MTLAVTNLAQERAVTVKTFIQTRSGVDLFVRDWGAGPPVVLLAGWALSSDLWGPVMLRLNDAGYRTIAFDRRGHGRSSDPGSIDYDLLADDLHDVLETLDLQACTIVAHSGAGGEVIRLATRHGDSRIGHLVLVGATLPAPQWTRDNPDGADPAIFEATNRQLAQDLHGWIDANARPFVSPDTPQRTIDWLAGLVMACSHRIIVDYQREIARTDFRAELATVTVPITIIQGDRDVSAPPPLCGGRLASLMPAARMITYEDAGHGPMITHAERLASDIAACAASVRPGRNGRPKQDSLTPAFAIAHLRSGVMSPPIIAYLEQIDATLTPFGGRFRVHGGTPDVLEGDWSGDLVILEFPDLARARAWYASDAYQAILPLRRDNAEGEVILLEGVPHDHRSIDILTAA